MLEQRGLKKNANANVQCIRPSKKSPFSIKVTWQNIPSRDERSKNRFEERPKSYQLLMDKII